MNNSEEIARLSASEARRLIGCGQLSPVEIMQACLEQVERYNGLVNAICTPSPTALEEARKAEKACSQGRELGLLHGLPVGIKDVTPTAGLRTTFGSRLYADHVPQEDALVVQRLKREGAIVLGKTNTPEFAAGAHTFNELFGSTRNPWNPALTAGGSTGGGAAALATSMVSLAEGSDLGGSLRIPAAFCGVVGLRPSPGLVPIYPSAFLWDNLQVVGPIARTAQDVALMLQATAGVSSLTPFGHSGGATDFVGTVVEEPHQGLRLAYCPDIAGIGMDQQNEELCRSAAAEIEQAGARVEEVELDLSFARQAFHALRGHWMVAHHLHHLDKVEQFGDNLAGNIRSGLAVCTEQLASAEQVRTRLWKTFRRFFQQYDHLLTPCTAVSPFPVEQNYPTSVGGKTMETYIDWFAPTFVLSLTGLPVASVPCGLLQEGLPVGLQIVGPAGGEARVLQLARLIQEACPIGFPNLGGL